MASAPVYTTQQEVRAAFWNTYPRLPRVWVIDENGRPCRPQNYQTTDTRVAFVEFVDALARDGLISEHLAARVTLR